MNVSCDEKPAPSWNVPVGRSATSKLTTMRSGVAPSSSVRLDPLEVAERHHALLRALDQRLAVELALDDARLAAQHFVAGLGVALDVDALDVDERAAPDRDHDVDDARVRVQVGLRVDLDVGVAVVAVVARDLLQVLGDDRRG